MKTIKLTEESLINIIKKIVSEQELGFGNKFPKTNNNNNNNITPFPEKKPIPQVQSQPDQTKVKYATHSAIIKGKEVVRHHLQSAIDAMEQLGAMSGINTETNDIVPNIKKAYEKFENLFGDPKPKVDSEDT